jgi:hypothetical protein
LHNHDTALPLDFGETKNAIIEVAGKDDPRNIRVGKIPIAC